MSLTPQTPAFGTPEFGCPLSVIRHSRPSGQPTSEPAVVEHGGALVSTHRMPAKRTGEHSIVAALGSKFGLHVRVAMEPSSLSWDMSNMPWSGFRRLLHGSVDLQTGAASSTPQTPEFGCPFGVSVIRHSRPSGQPTSDPAVVEHGGALLSTHRMPAKGTIEHSIVAALGSSTLVGPRPCRVGIGT